MTIESYALSLPKPYGNAFAAYVAPVKRASHPHDAVTCLDHAVFCARHGFYSEAVRYAVRSLTRPVW